MSKIIIDSFFQKEQEIFKYFGYKEDWVKIPLEDSTMYLWHLDEDKNGSGSVTFWLNQKELDENTFYSYDIYTQRFLSKWVYRKDDYTMISVATGVDGNKYLSLFDNAKEIKEYDEEKHKNIINF